MGEKKKSCSGCLVKLLVVVGVLVLIGLVGFNLLQRSKMKINNSSPGLFERKASARDMELYDSYSFPVSITLTVVPKENIEDLEILIQYLDSSGRIVKSQRKFIGDVRTGGVYEFDIKLTDFTVSQLAVITRCQYAVSGGTISFFD
ncbi:MAG: hypothetical protein IJF64_04235 [Clostridia bacterium]|nr:hypothetical protein [Clostridia bacterium]